ncbi:MAG: 50S ribosomal protein L11 methyltransferase [Deltaproteobacteria bacterium]|nr:50S ribosomal protein L11 methyltransferase [Deltaproteobacteria bacterium]
MKWIEAKIVFVHADKDLATDLISDLFYEFGLQGVVVDDPGIEPGEDWAEDTIGRPAHHAVTGYIPQDSRADARCQILEKRLEGLKQKLDLFYRISYKELDEQDWAHAWKAYFWPRKISSHIVVKPTWRDYQANNNEIVIELDPGMAFGTGTHPTTALCAGMLEKHLKKGESFLDVGTGSGILMLAAAKLGAGRVCGVDKDEMAVNIAASNLRLNGIQSQNFRVSVGNLIEETSEIYDIVAANILTHVILDLLTDIRRVIKDAGIFICSGIIEKHEKKVVSSMKNIGFEILEVHSKDEWRAIAGRLGV